MLSPALALQKALVAVMRSGPVQAAAVTAFKVYDKPPADAPTPYVTIGYVQTLGDLAQGYNGSELVAELHVWSQAGGWEEPETIAAAIRAGAAPQQDPDTPPPFALDGHQLVTWTFRGTHPLPDPDGVTRRVVVWLEYQTRPTA